MPRKIRVAAIQMNCQPGEIAKNLAHAEIMIARAAEQGAALVLLPELMPSGYMATEEIWNSAETIDGHSVTWLLRTAKRFGIYLGFSFLEAEGEDFIIPLSYQAETASLSVGCVKIPRLR